MVVVFSDTSDLLGWLRFKVLPFSLDHHLPRFELQLDDLTRTAARNLHMYLRAHLVDNLCAYCAPHTHAVLTFSTVSMRATNNNAGRKFMAATIFLLYIFTTVSFSFDWAFKRYAYVSNGETFYSAFLALEAIGPWWRTYRLVTSISGGINTVLADIAMIWRCWVIWTHNWLIVAPAIICTVAGTLSKVFQIYDSMTNVSSDISRTSGYTTKIDWTILYLSFTLATTVLTTLLIIFRIVKVGNSAPGTGLSSYRRVIEMLIESAALYSLSVIGYMGLVASNDHSAYYADAIMAYIKGIAPTLLVARVASGQGLSSNTKSSQESRLSPLRFRQRSFSQAPETTLGGSSSGH
ncbi:uncharacterized protein EV420DRAFT_1757997 [Desarmillaria tabescens]|uniref:Uncharacterized protein n=1 Tax=Armillaria tabescens TaxID=1929756 RepID=A0AA39NLB5_ARMTA|nr:uncharacterized protein EV420DRAFT_1757997 [Desarmillaria tabescens]KAK0467721.1 hypothetical protein EV420DRAFT_1757997 [Desarmillaria tabescens]